LGPLFLLFGGRSLILSLFLTSYGQRSRTSFVNICVKKNFDY
jgi:hypothetical protein